MQQFGDIVYRKCIKLRMLKTDYKLSGHPTINLSVGVMDITTALC